MPADVLPFNTLLITIILITENPWRKLHVHILSSTIPSEDLPVVFPVGGVDVLSFTAIPCMDGALTANSPKLLFVAAVRSVFTTEASDTIDANSRASLTIKLPQLQVQRQ